MLEAPYREGFNRSCKYVVVEVMIVSSILRRISRSRRRQRGKEKEDEGNLRYGRERGGDGIEASAARDVYYCCATLGGGFSELVFVRLPICMANETIVDVGALYSSD